MNIEEIKRDMAQKEERIRLTSMIIDKQIRDAKRAERIAIGGIVIGVGMLVLSVLNVIFGGGN